MLILKTLSLPFKSRTLSQVNHFSFFPLQFKYQLSNGYFFFEILQSSTEIEHLQQAHALLLLTGQEQSTIFATKLLNSYAENGRLRDATAVFNRTKNPHVFLWNSIIKWYWKYGYSEEALGFYQKMLESREEPDNSTFNFVLRAHADLGSVQNAIKIYKRARERGFKIDAAVGTELVSLFCRFGCIDHAQQVFDEMSDKNVVHWTAMITGFVRNGYHTEALKLFTQMLVSGIAPNSFTIVTVLTNSAHLGNLILGKLVHGCVIRTGLESDLFVGTALIDMYAKCGDVDNAYKVFDKMPEPNLTSWNAMISGFIINRFFEEALLLFKQFGFFDLLPNSVTMLSVIRGCINLESPELCHCIHGCIVSIGLDLNTSVINSILDMYSSLGDLQDARKIFYEMPVKDVISWTTLMGGFMKIEQVTEAQQLFHRMRVAGFDPDMVTMLNMLTACSLSGDLQMGRSIHNQIIVYGFCSELPIANSLISTYCKCADTNSARTTFDYMPKKSMVSWTAMISGFAQNGQAKEALSLMISMRTGNIDPDSATLVNSLSACAELAQLELCKQFHAYTITAGFLGDNSVQNSLIATYAKCGDIGFSQKIFKNLCFRDIVSWNAIISGCGINGNGVTALALFRDMERGDVELDGVTYISVLNACSHAGLVDDGMSIFRSMVREGKVQPRKEHYACVVDMLARAGRLEEASKFVTANSWEPSLNAWRALLGGCWIHNEVQLADIAAEHLLCSDPANSGNVVLLSNVYAAAGRFKEAESLRLDMRMKGLMKNPGLSLINTRSRNFG